jgi:hypothetical protein
MFVVCRNKTDNTLFITTRMARETMINVLHSIGEIPDSNVLKECKTYDEADHFKKEQERIDKELNNILPNQ